MKLTDRYLAYAAAFEAAFDSDDWSVVEPFFTEDVVYECDGGPPFAGRWEGRQAVLANFKQTLDRFDRRFSAKRSFEVLEGPLERDGGTWARLGEVYPLAGAADLVFELVEEASFDGDRIRRIVDRIPESMAERARAYIEAHGARLGLTARG